MKIASFNVENFFTRAKALNTMTWEEGRPALAAFERFNAVANKASYGATDKQVMLDALVDLGILYRTTAGSLRVQKNSEKAFGFLRENRGDFLKQPKTGDVEVVANGRSDWIGWVELTVEPVNETAVRMTAKVIEELDADVLAVVEAENRTALVRFNDQLLGRRYAHVMLVDGNDPRGIDVALMTQAQVEIISIRSHVDDPDPTTARPLFSRDAPVYQLRTGAIDLYVIVNHLKSQSWTSGNPDPLRTRQANRVVEIYADLRHGGATDVAVVGDFNKGPTNDDPPRHPTLEALFQAGNELVDATTLAAFDSGPRPGTFQSCGVRDRLDYIFLSPQLAAKVAAGGVFRKGLWGAPTNKNPPKSWAIYPEITAPLQAASDHAAIWIDVDL